MRKFLLCVALTMLLVRTNAQVIFQEQISTNSVYDMMLKSIVPCSDSGFLIGASGYWYGSYLTKTDAHGQPQWVSAWTASPSGNFTLIQSGESATGGYFVLGYNTDTSASLNGFYLASFDNGGNFQSAKVYTTQQITYAHSRIKQTVDGGFVIMQSFYNGIGLLRIDPSGNILWHHCYSGDSASVQFNPAIDFALDSTGNIILVASQDSIISVIKFDTSGIPEWNRVYTNGTSDYFPEAISPASGNNYVIAGTCDSLPFVMKIDSAGSISWFNTYDFMGHHYSISERENGNLLLNGYYFTGWNTIEELDSNGLPVMGQATFSTYQNSAFHCLTADSGFAVADILFNGNTLHNDILLLKSNADDSIHCDYQDLQFGLDVFISSPTMQNAPLYPLNDTSTVSSIVYFVQHPIASRDSLCTGVGIANHDEVKAEVRVYPSPATNENITVEVQGITGECVLTVTDELGRIAYTSQETFAEGKNIIAGFPLILNAGLYNIRITDKSGNLIAASRFCSL